MDYMQFYSQRLQKQQFGAQKEVSLVERAKRYFLPKYKAEQEALEKKQKNKRMIYMGLGTLALGVGGFFVWRKFQQEESEENQNQPIEAQIEIEQIQESFPGEGIDDLMSQLKEEVNEPETQVDTQSVTQTDTSGSPNLFAELGIGQDSAKALVVDTSSEKSGIETNSEAFVDLSGGNGFSMQSVSMNPIAIE